VTPVGPVSPNPVAPVFVAEPGIPVGPTIAIGVPTTLWRLPPLIIVIVFDGVVLLKAHTRTPILSVVLMIVVSIVEVS
jgi:hypothetical protein